MNIDSSLCVALKTSISGHLKLVISVKEAGQEGLVLLL